jgi:hypothetical protein
MVGLLPSRGVSGKPRHHPASAASVAEAACAALIAPPRRRWAGPVHSGIRCGGADTWVDIHVGCAKAAPYCVLSTTSEPFNKARQPRDKTPLRRSPYLGEIMVMRDNGAEIRRLAAHRGLRFSSEDALGYWSTPRAAISPDGAYVVADSNFGMPNRQRVIVIETGFGKPSS